MDRLPRLALLGSALLGIYFVSSRHPLSAPTVLTNNAAVPFLPELAPIYLTVLLLGWFAPLLIDDDERYVACVRACLIAFVVTMLLWLLLPTSLPRPPVEPSTATLVYRVMIRCDAPTNIFPCGHILAPVIGGWHLWRDRPQRWPWLMALILVTALSIVGTWQHRPIDVLAGTLIAVGSIAVVAAVRRQRATQMN